MSAALEKLCFLEQPTLPEDVARLSPLGYKHINMLERYYFSLAEPVLKGELRPLRDPDAGDDVELILSVEG
jgi:hypothetical protein